MSDDLREVLASVGDADFAAAVMHGDDIDPRMSFNGATVMRALRQVEQRAFERAAQVLDEQRAIYEQGPSVLLGWSVTQAKIRQLERLAADIRALSTPSLIRESTKGQGL